MQQKLPKDLETKSVLIKLNKNKICGGYTMIVGSHVVRNKAHLRVKFLRVSYKRL